MDPSLETLFARYRATNDPAALGALFDRTSPQLLALALHLLGHPADAEDALQTTFVTAIDRAHAFDPARPLLPWLCGILTNHCRQVRERRARRREVPELPEIPLEAGSPVQASERRELVARLRQHIERLPFDQRQALLLQLEHGLAPAEIAEVVGVPPGTVRMRLHRAVKALRGGLPAGLVLALQAALPARGLVAVRTAVLAHAAPVGGGLSLGWLLAAALLVFGIGGWGWRPWAEPGALAMRGSGAQRVVASVDGELRATRTDDHHRELAGAPGSAAAATPRLGALRVQVCTASGKRPVPGALVTVGRTDDDRDGEFTQQAAVAGSDGWCEFADLEPGPYRVTSWLGQFPAPEATSVVVPAGGTANLLLCALDEVVSERLHVQVVTALGHPAAGAEIVVGRVGPYGRMATLGCTAADGWATVPWVPGMVCGARRPGAAPSALYSPMGGTARIVLHEPGAALVGAVVDELGAPVANAHLLVGERKRQAATGIGPDRELFGASQPGRNLVTDQDGGFELADLPEGPVRLVVCAAGFASLDRCVELTPGVATTITLRLLRGRRVAGCVVDAEGVPVVGARVMLDGTNSRSLRTTDADGDFAFGHVALGPHTVSVESPEVECAAFDCPESSNAGLRLVVRRLPKFAVQLVTPNGTPCAHWRVGLDPIRGWSCADGAGRAVLFRQQSAVATLWLGRPLADQPLHAMPLHQPLHPGVETVVLVPAEWPAMATVRGRVVTAQGGPVDEAVVCLTNETGQVQCQRLPAAHGQFDLAVPSGSALRLLVERRDAATAWFELPALAAGEVRDLGAVRLPAEGLLSLRLRRGDGQPVLAEHLFLWPVEAPAFEMQSPPCDGQPHPWRAGRYCWSAMVDGHLWQRGEVEIRAGQLTALEVLLEPGVRRFLVLPVPMPDWGTPERVDFVLRDPSGAEYLRDAFDPREELPYRFGPALSVGTWQVELSIPDGRRWSGRFLVPDLQPTNEPIRVAVAPAR